MEEEKYNKEKYFLDPNRNKIYALKGEGHKGLAYRELRRIGLEHIYYYYEKTIPASKFLIYCGYVLVDEAEQEYEVSWDSCKVTKFITVGYCSKTIDENYVKYLLDTYDNGKNVIEDGYDTEDISKKNKIDEIIKRIKTVREEQEKRQERQLDGESR